MKGLLDQFWTWFGTTPEIYAQTGVGNNVSVIYLEGRGDITYHAEECDFLYFEELICGAKKIIDENIMDDVAIDQLLTIMALDNGAELVREYIEDKSTHEQFEKIIHKGIYHMQSEARWQIAELIYRKRPEGYIEYLQILLKMKILTSENELITVSRISKTRGKKD